MTDRVEVAFRCSPTLERAVRAGLRDMQQWEARVLMAWHDEHPALRPMWRTPVGSVSTDLECVGFEDALPSHEPPDGLSRNRARRELIPVRGKAGDPWREQIGVFRTRPVLTPVFRDHQVDTLVLAGSRIVRPGIHLDPAPDAEPGHMLMHYTAEPGASEHLERVPMSEWWREIEAYEAAHTAAASRG